MAPMKKWALVILGLIVSILFLWLILSGAAGDVHATDVLMHMSKVSITWFAFAVAALALNYPANTFRFECVLSRAEAVKRDFFQLLAVIWTSAFLSLATPSTLFSDGFRVTLMRVLRITDFSLAVRAVLLDRFTGLLYMLGLAGVMLLILPVGLRSDLTNLGGLLFLVAFLGAIATVFIASAVVNKVALMFRLRSLVDGMRRLMSTPGWIALFLGFALFNATTFAVCLWCVARGLDADIGLWPLFVLSPAILVVNNLPIFYQGFGGREAMMVLVIGSSVGTIDANLTVAVSLLSGGALVVSALLGAGFTPFVALRRKH